MSGHEGNEPCSQDSCALPELVAGHRGDGEDGQCTVNGRQAEHAEPNGVSRVAQERFENHGANSNRPREEWRSRIDATGWVKPISIVHQVSVVGEDVVHNPLHVPRVGATGHVPHASAEGVH